MMVDPDTHSSPNLVPSDPVPTGATRSDPAAGEPLASEGRSRLEIPGYDLESEIGRGGMGVVYRARDLSLSRDLAIKVLQSKYGTGSYAAVRFLEEARITAQLQHPGIPPIHAVGAISDGRPFLAMKLIKGRTLDEILNDPLTAHHSVLIPAFEQICQAVAYAHNHGVIHRDLKPHNVMVGAFGEIQVMDWGLAKFRSERRATSAETSVASTFYDPREESDENSKTRAGSFLGTPAYMSPEQALGAIDQIDERSDVFGLGAVLCSILTGRPPFLAENAESTRMLAAQGKLESAFARLDSCGAERELVELCKLCLSPDSKERPANAGVVAKTVAEFRAASESRARQAELDRVKAEGERAAADLKATEQRKRRQVQMALGLAFTALVVLGMAFAWWRDRQATERRAEQAAATSRAEQSLGSAIELAVIMRDKYRFAEAALALDQAEAFIAADAPASIRERLDAARRELAFVRRLDTIRLSRIQSDFIKGIVIADASYLEAFREHGLDPTGADLDAVGDRVAASPIRKHLITALDDWSWFARDFNLRPRLLAVVRRADPGPWSNRLRDEAVRANPEAMDKLAEEMTPDTPANLIVLYMQLRQTLPGAAKLLAAATLRHPDDFWLQFEAGFYYHSKSVNFPLAVSHFRAAHTLRADLPLVTLLLGEALGGLRKYDEAIACIREAIRLDGRLATAWSRLGTMLSLQNEPAAAIAAYREAARLQPGDARTQNLLGNALFSLKDFDGAAEAYRNAIAAAPTDAMLHHNLGLALAKQKDIPRAIAAMQEAIRLLPTEVQFHFRLGEAFLFDGEPNRALASFEAAMKLEPSDVMANAHAVNMCAWILAAGPASVRDGKRALRLATRACELMDWLNPDCIDTLAAAHAECGDFEKAVEFQKKALEIPRNRSTRGHDAYISRLGLYIQKLPYRLLTPAPPPRPVIR